MASFYTADTICFVANPDVPSVRNAQRLLERIGQLGSCRDRVRLLLNRAAEPYPIPPAQIESALGHPIHHTFPSDYRTVSTALNSGVPVALTGNSGIAEQFDRFTRRLLDTAGDAPAAVAVVAAQLARSGSSGSRPSGKRPWQSPRHPRCAPTQAVPSATRAAPRQQYLDLRASVHRKLLNRLNLEALAQHRSQPAPKAEIRALLGQLLAEESDAAQP